MLYVVIIEHNPLEFSVVHEQTLVNIVSLDWNIFNARQIFKKIFM